MIFKAPAAVAFSLFGYDIRYYGIMLFIGMLAGIFVSLGILKKHYKNLNTDMFLDFLPFLIIVSIVFARLYYVILDLDFYIKHPAEIPAIWHGGIAIHGAILGGIIAGVVYFKLIKKTALLPYADVVSYGLVIGQAIGRWGNFFNSEAFGCPCDLPWKLYIEPISRPIQYADYSYFHPAFLYESIWDICVFLILFFFVRKWAQNKPGIVFFGYLGLYSVGRMIIENIRIDSVLNVVNMPIALIASIFGLLVSIFGIFFIRRKNAV